MKPTHSFSELSDRELVAETKRLALNESCATAALIRSLIELDARRLYLAESCGTLFKYCTEVLHLSEDAAYNRLEVAAAARRLPAVLDALEEGSLTLTAARRLAPHLTGENCATVLAAAKFKSKGAIEELIARLSPQPDVKATIRKLPQLVDRAPAPPGAPTNEVLPEQPKPAPASTPLAQLESAPVKSATQTATSASTRPLVQALAPARFKIQFTIGQETREKLKEVQDLLRHSIRNGDLEQIFARAITLLLNDARRQRFADTARPREGRELLPGSRHVPAAVQRLVWKRDEGRCAFVGPNGRCSETSLLQFHHEDPFAMGGPPTAENISLRCAAHNRYEAELFFAVEYPGIVREERPAWPEVEYSSRNENEAPTGVVPSSNSGDCGYGTDPGWPSFRNDFASGMLSVAGGARRHLALSKGPAPSREKEPSRSDVHLTNRATATAAVDAAVAVDAPLDSPLARLARGRQTAPTATWKTAGHVRGFPQRPQPSSVWKRELAFVPERLPPP